MKLLYVTDQVYLHGGAEKILIQKMNYWVEVFGYEVMLVTTQQNGRKPFIHINEKVQMCDLGINYSAGTFYSKANLAKIPVHYKALKTAISNFGPDAVFVLSQTLSRYISPFAAGNAKTFFEYHTSYYGFELGQKKQKGIRKLKSKMLSKLARFAEDRYTKVVYLNQWEFDHYKRKNSIIIPNFFEPVSEASRLKQNKVISLGRLSFQKGYDLLIKAWELLDDKIEGWQCDIYGNGENADILRKQIKAKSFKNPITVHDAIDDINGALSESSIYAMSSRFETFPMVLLEAFSHKLPVAAFDCPTGPRSIVTNGKDGILVPPGDIQALADSIVELCNNPEKRVAMGENGFKAIQQFSPEAVMKLWDNTIKTSTT